MSPGTILIVGATGQQGSAVLSALSSLLSYSSPKPKILALTRTATAPKARALLTAYPTLDLHLVEGNTRDPGPIFAAHPDISAVFSYTTPPDEVPQATALIDAAAAAAAAGRADGEGVHFVFSSVDRGGDQRSWENPCTGVPHFRQKHDVEVYLRSACEKQQREGESGRETRGKMTYTILRPAAFMDNLNPTSAFGAVFASLWWTMPRTTRLQLVGVRDVGLVGAKALLLLSASPPGAAAAAANPSTYRNRAIGLAGDELSLLEARAVYRRVAGSQLPQAWGVVGYAVRWLVREVGAMFDFFEGEGYGVDIEGLRRDVEPDLQGFERWLRESSRFEVARGGGKGV